MYLMFDEVWNGEYNEYAVDSRKIGEGREQVSPPMTVNKINTHQVFSDPLSIPAAGSLQWILSTH